MRSMMFKGRTGRVLAAMFALIVLTLPAFAKTTTRTVRLDAPPTGKQTTIERPGEEWRMIDVPQPTTLIMSIVNLGDKPVWVWLYEGRIAPNARSEDNKKDWSIERMRVEPDTMHHPHLSGPFRVRGNLAIQADGPAEVVLHADDQSRT